MLQLVCHVLHIAATCTSLGGLFYARVVLWPNLIHVPDEARSAYLDRMIRRFAYVKWTGVGVVALTGIVQWVDIWPQVADRESYVQAFLVKMIGAVGLFTITFLLALPNERLRGMQRHRGFWAAVNILCGVLILVGAALMRSARTGL